MPKLLGGGAVCTRRLGSTSLGRRSHSSCSRSLGLGAGPATRPGEVRSSTFAKFDRSGTGQLEPDELRLLLQELTPEAGPLTDDEVSFVLQVGDKDRSGGLDHDELPPALVRWQAYCQTRPRVQQLLARYDTDRSGRLDRGQLRTLLSQALSGRGGEVTDDELDEVFRVADVCRDGLISQPELSLAVAQWFRRHPPPA